jgi:hypothetical protein
MRGGHGHLPSTVAVAALDRPDEQQLAALGNGAQTAGRPDDRYASDEHRR